MMNVKYYSLISWYCMIVVTAMTIVTNIAVSPQMGVACVIGLVVVMTFYCLADFTRRIGLATFMVCLFTFQLAGIALPILMNNSEWMMGFTENEYVMICNCLFITCLTLLITNSLLEKYKLVWGRDHRNLLGALDDSHFNIGSIQKWAFVICISSTAVAIAGEGQRLIYALSNGYMALYGGYSVPAMVTRMLFASKVSMFIGLAARPSKKRALTYLALGLPVSVMTLLEGARGEFVSYIVFYAYYLYTYADWRGTKINAADRKRKFRKFVFVIAIISCVALPLLYIYGYTRVGHSYDGTVSGPLAGILNFFASQGGSVKQVGNAIHYKGQLPGTCYSLGSIVDRIQGNHHVSYSIGSALRTNSFGNIMSYLDSPYNYLTLHVGVGSSYIAEVYYDFGYLGLIVVSCIIAWTLKLLTLYQDVSVFKKSFLFMIFYYMFTLPRAPLLNPINNVFSTSTLSTIFIIFFFSRKRN